MTSDAYVRFGLLSLAILAAGPMLAAGFEGDLDKVLAVVSGETEAGGELRLSLSAGPGEVKALRVFSEPSHTPLACALSASFVASAEGQAWRDEWPEEPTLVAELAELSGAGFEQLFERPPGDDALEVWAWAEWPDGAAEERLVSAVEPGDGEFLFFSAIDDPPGKTTHCCGLEDGSEVCVVCGDALFRCDPGPVCGH